MLSKTNDTFSPRIERSSRRPWGAALALTGVSVFIAVVVVLQALQENYTPIHQLMSELVFGSFGWIMIFAFSGLAVSAFGIQFELKYYQAAPALRILLWLSSLSFLGAGVFKLGEYSEIHISCIAMAFVLSVLAMYLFPSSAGQAANLAPRGVSWSLAACVTISVAIGEQLIPIGVGQRLAALFLLMWMAIIGWQMWRRDKNVP